MDYFLFPGDKAPRRLAWQSAVSSEVIVILASLFALYAVKRISAIRAEWVIYALIVVLNVTINVYFFIDPENSLI